MSTQDMVDLTKHRKESFRIMIESLTNFNSPLIVETGCIRQADSFAGDGMSTLIFDNYVAENGGEFYSVDNNLEAVKLARARVTENTKIYHTDSIRFLNDLSTALLSESRYIDLLYLDSFNYTPELALESSLHPVYELLAARPALRKGSIIAVDDNFFHGDQHSGKGKLVYQFMDKINCKCIHKSYQCIWIM